MIDQARIDAVKKEIDLKTYIESRGISLKKERKGIYRLLSFS